MNSLHFRLCASSACRTKSTLADYFEVASRLHRLRNVENHTVFTAHYHVNSICRCTRTTSGRQAEKQPFRQTCNPFLPVTRAAPPAPVHRVLWTFMNCTFAEGAERSKGLCEGAAFHLITSARHDSQAARAGQCFPMRAVILGEWHYWLHYYLYKSVRREQL